MPVEARLDLEERVWTDEDDARSFVRRMFDDEIDVRGLVGDDPTLLITDDKPFNEYYLLRRWLD